jgi:hypothetical protein
MALMQETVDSSLVGQRVGPKGKWLFSRQLQYKAAYSLLRGMMPAWHFAPACLS